MFLEQGICIYRRNVKKRMKTRLSYRQVCDFSSRKRELAALDPTHQVSSLSGLAAVSATAPGTTALVQLDGESAALNGICKVSKSAFTFFLHCISLSRG